ncbi:hypothetical protein TNCV_4499461 [Trichonephila clavipes]|nr:hypothetical protein TNCV_4499461 [Trichonephila clavipes]
MNLETSDTILQGAPQKGIKDPNNPLVRIESSYMELTNMRLQKAPPPELRHLLRIVGSTFVSLGGRTLPPVNGTSVWQTSSALRRC